MKKSLKVGVAVVALLAISGTLLAQSYGTSTIQKMKEGVKNFTLSWDLNNGQSGLQSAPLTGKRTGDMLTAAEYNRMLELISEGGGTTVVSGGGTGGSGWTDVSLTDTADFDNKCDYLINTANGGSLRATFIHPTIIGFIKNEFDTNSAASWYGVRKTNKSTLISHQDNWSNNIIYPNITVTSISKNCGGGSGGTNFNWGACTTEWVGTPTNGTPYTNSAGKQCKYTGTGPGVPGVNYYYLCC